MLASLKTLTNSIDCSENSSEFLFEHSFSDIGRFSPLCMSWPAFGKIFSVAAPFRATFLESWAAFRMLQQALRRRLLKGFIELVNVLIEARKLFSTKRLLI